MEGDEIETILGDISDIKTLSNNKYNMITMLGVLSIFDDYETVLYNVVSLLEEDGVVYVFGIFNPKPLDVLIKSRNANDEMKKDVWESGWNYFSKLSIKKYCNKRGYTCQFIPFHLGIDIEENKKDPLRSWTIDINNETKMVVNGL